jgi:hypothetical protein
MQIPTRCLFTAPLIAIPIPTQFRLMGSTDIKKKQQDVVQLRPYINVPWTL